jgi:hypothetical protein
MNWDTFEGELYSEFEFNLEPAVAAAHLVPPCGIDHLPSASTARRTFQVRLRVAALAIWFNLLRDLSPGLLPDLG